MIVSKVKKQPKKNKVISSEPSEVTQTTAMGICVSEDTIRARAFQVYQSRGSQSGDAIQDWLHAEHQILEH